MTFTWTRAIEHNPLLQVPAAVLEHLNMIACQEFQLTQCYSRGSSSGSGLEFPFLSVLTRSFGLSRVGGEAHSHDSAAMESLVSGFILAIRGVDGVYEAPYARADKSSHHGLWPHLHAYAGEARSNVTARDHERGSASRIVTFTLLAWTLFVGTLLTCFWQGC